MRKWLKIGLISCLSSLIVSVGLVLFTKIYFDNTRKNDVVISDQPNFDQNNNGNNSDKLPGEEDSNNQGNTNDDSTGNIGNISNLTNVSLLSSFSKNKYNFLNQTTNYQSFFTTEGFSFSYDKIKSNLYKIVNNYVVETTKVDLTKNTLDLKIYFQTLNNYKELKIYSYWTIKPINSLLDITKRYYDIIDIIIK